MPENFEPLGPTFATFNFNGQHIQTLALLKNQISILQSELIIGFNYRPSFVDYLGIFTYRPPSYRMQDLVTDRLYVACVAQSPRSLVSLAMGPCLEIHIYVQMAITV